MKTTEESEKERNILSSELLNETSLIESLSGGIYKYKFTILLIESLLNATNSHISS